VVNCVAGKRSPARVASTLGSGRGRRSHRHRSGTRPRAAAPAAPAGAVVNFGQVAVNNDGNQWRKDRPKNGMVEANGEAWKLVAKAFTEIAPRRSPVRVPLAPLAKGLQTRPFVFHNENETRPKSTRGQVVVKSARQRDRTQAIAWFSIAQRGP
jgi:hypothetical protein